eukprot:Skav211222  [mRNA]  locus=scaffold934:178363:180517:- [translate_table: standard]
MVCHRGHGTGAAAKPRVKDAREAKEAKAKPEKHGSSAAAMAVVDLLHVCHVIETLQKISGVSIVNMGNPFQKFIYTFNGEHGFLENCSEDGTRKRMGAATEASGTVVLRFREDHPFKPKFSKPTPALWKPEKMTGTRDEAPRELPGLPGCPW